MSFQSFVTQQLASINSILNSIATNAKKIDELPVQANLDPSSKIHVSRSGISESLEVRKIIDVITSGSDDKLLSIGKITLAGNIATIPANAEWRISNVYYGNTSVIQRIIPYCTAGLIRKDILVANTLNNIFLVQGTETAGIAFRPNVPINTVFVTEIDVTEANIQITQPDLSGYATINYVDGKDALKEDKSNKVSTITGNETDEVKYPSVKAAYDSDVYFLEFGKAYSDSQDAILNDKITSLAKATCHTGITDTGDTVDIVQLTNTTFKITAIASAIFHEKFYELGEVAIKSFPETTHNVSIVPTTQNGTSVWCVGKDYDGNIQFSSSSFTLNTNVVGIGYLYILRTAGVNNFLFSGIDSRNVLVIPDISGVSTYDRTVFGISSSVRIFANTGNVMTLNNGIGGKVKRMSANWMPGTRNEFNDERNVSATTLISFLRLNPSTTLSTSPPASVTSLDVTTYWNGTAMVPLTGNNYASVQAVYCSSRGGIVILAGEQEFNTFQLAKDSMWQVKFTSLLPNDTFAEIGRIVAVRNATVISDTSKVLIDPISSNGSGGNGGPDATKEDTVNKTDDYVNNQSSSVKFLSIKGVENFWTWVKTQAQTITGSWTFSNKVTLAVGTVATPPLVIPKGVLTTTPQDGAIEVDPNNIYYTDGSVRYPILSKYLYNGTSLQFIKWIYTNTAPGTFSEEILQFPTPEQSWFTLGGPRILMKADFFIDRNYFNTSFKLTNIRIVLVSINKGLTVNVGTLGVGNGNGNIILPMEWDFSLLQRGYSFYLVCKYKNYTGLTSAGAGQEQTMMARLDGYSTSYDWGNVAWNLKFYMDYTVETSPAANEQVFISHLLTRRVRTIL